MTQATDSKYQAIEKAFRCLKILPAMDGRLATFIQPLADLSPASAIPSKFRKTSKATCIKELTELQACAAKLIKCLDALHEPAIVALADHGFCNERRVVSQLARQLVNAADSAAKSGEDVPPDKREGRGRPRKPQPLVVARMLAHNYRTLTGKRPTIRTHAGNDKEGQAYGPYLELVKAVFEAIGIDANAESMAKTAIRALKEEISPK
jgi:hypothetical protein